MDLKEEYKEAMMPGSGKFFARSLVAQKTIDCGSILVFLLVLVFLTAALSGVCRASAILETSNLLLEISDTGYLNSLKDKSSGTEYAYGSSPAFSMQSGGSTYNASAVTRSGSQLDVVFGSSGVTAKYEIISDANNQYVALRLNLLSGGSVDSINLLQLRVKRLSYLGDWINVSYDDKFGICLCGGNVMTNASMDKFTSYVDMKTTAYSEFGLVGTTAVLFGFDATDAKNNFLDVMEVVEEDFNMPAGAKNRRSPIQKYSYFWLTDTSPDNINDCIAWAKQGGFRMILLSYESFSNCAGHFPWKSSYPNGMADLKAVTDAVRNAGLKLGLHIHYNKAHKNDLYVTPEPDDRLHKVRTFTLTDSINSTTTEITVNENPVGSEMGDGRRILKVNTELIEYSSFTTSPPYQFIGCDRGHLDTVACSHSAGVQIGLLDVDDWNIFIRFDQDSDIQDEVAQRIADIFEQTGPYDMVYFDGAEDVHDPFWYHVPNAGYRVYQHFDPEPPVCESSSRFNWFTPSWNFDWHMMSRSNAYDYPHEPSEIKTFCRTRPCVDAPDSALNFTRINFGWLLEFGKSVQSYISPDILEYVLSRGAAWDCPFSMRVSLRQLDNNPLTEDCLDVIKIWEDVRINNKLTESHRQQLVNLEQEHHMFINELGEHELVAINEVPNVAEGSNFLAYSFERKSAQGDTYVLIWPVSCPADLILPLSLDQVLSMRPFGTVIPLETSNGKLAIPVSNRRYLVFPDMSVDEVSSILQNAETSPDESTVIYLASTSHTSIGGGMTLASSIGITDDGMINNDAVVPTRTNSYVEYTFDLPYKGTWYLWARMKYEDAGSNSFFAAPADSLDEKQILGNSNLFDQWLWDNGTKFSVDEPGEFSIRISVREDPGSSPLLDVLCLSKCSDYEPNDADCDTDVDDICDSCNDNGTCPANYMLGSEDPRLETLRKFRNRVLSKSLTGKKLIELYYENGKRIVSLFDKNPTINKTAKKVLDSLVSVMEMMLQDKD